MSNHYETVFILNPVLSEDQIKEAVKKFEDYIVAAGGEIVSYENWGLKKFAYPIANKKSGFYHLMEFTAPSSLVASITSWSSRVRATSSKSSKPSTAATNA